MCLANVSISGLVKATAANPGPALVGTVVGAVSGEKVC